jgi:hypothetical protein
MAGVEPLSPVRTGMLFGWELVLSFILVSVVYAVAIGEPSFGNIAPFAVGLSLVVDLFAGAQCAVHSCLLGAVAGIVRRALPCFPYVASCNQIEAAHWSPHSFQLLISLASLPPHVWGPAGQFRERRITACRCTAVRNQAGMHVMRRRRLLRWRRQPRPRAGPSHSVPLVSARLPCSSFCLTLSSQLEDKATDSKPANCPTRG